jgi:hypothetical protein
MFGGFARNEESDGADVTVTSEGPGQGERKQNHRGFVGPPLASKPDGQPEEQGSRKMQVAARASDGGMTQQMEPGSVSSFMLHANSRAVLPSCFMRSTQGPCQRGQRRRGAGAPG